MSRRDDEQGTEAREHTADRASDGRASCRHGPTSPDHASASRMDDRAARRIILPVFALGRLPSGGTNHLEPSGPNLVKCLCGEKKTRMARMSSTGPVGRPSRIVKSV